ncbi:hypothetical protein IHE45_10G033400 [Dioscorea alata]|uniref:Uncharacterized protein n=1 Tax=Dioscorea alata TaxID=55571 RepID=A0ACB7V9U9_DIOAL|nr:hypothetical protein IHE45_10G033400 [Dioscorea alata]
MSKRFSMFPTISKHPHLQLLVNTQQMESWQTEAFEKLGPCKDFPITHYFDSHAQLFAQVSAKTANKDHYGKARNGDHKEGSEKQNQVKDMISEKKKEPSTHLNAPKAVDEDLYKIPPELLHKKSKHKRLQISSWVGCLGMSCMPCCP